MRSERQSSSSRTLLLSAGMCALAAAGGLALLAGQGSSMMFAELRASVPVGDRIMAIDPARAREARRVFAGALAGQTDEAMLARIGLRPVAVNGGTALAEADEDRRGRGLYLIRGGGLPVLVSAPHQTDDIDTGRIASRLVDELDFSAAALNTARRRVTGADAAHVPLSLFTAFHIAFARHYPAARIVQLHGFAAEKRSTPEARQADVILSSGERSVGPAVSAIARCLAARNVRVALFPRDVDELGGTQNANLAALREEGLVRDGLFVHVEMARPFRQRLMDDRALRLEFGHCMGVNA